LLQRAQRSVGVGLGQRCLLGDRGNEISAVDGHVGFPLICRNRPPCGERRGHTTTAQVQGKHFHAVSRRVLAKSQRFPQDEAFLLSFCAHLSHPPRTASSHRKRAERPHHQPSVMS